MTVFATRTMERLTWAMTLMVFACSAAGQYAPAGNEHPQTEDAYLDESLAPPFGHIVVPEELATVDERVRAKVAFARAVDLGPLRALAVEHGGRVKVLDTLARETVEAITGQTRYPEALPESGDDSALKYKFDPMFTLIDLMIDPYHYTDRPVVHVGFLPLREAFLEYAMPIARDADEATKQEILDQRKRWLTLTRISPAMAQAFAPVLDEEYAFDQPYRAALSRVRRAMNLWGQSSGNLKLIAPATTDDPWVHISASYTRSDEVQTLARDFGAAWRAHDAARVNDLAVQLAELIPTIHPDIYPGRSRTLELAYNKANLFQWGYATYLLALIVLLLAFGVERRWLIAVGVTLLIFAVGLHATGFVLRSVIAQRFAIQNQFESMTGVSLFASIVGVTIMLIRRQWLFGAAAAATGFMVLVTATETSIPGQSIGREAAILNTSVLLKYHVTTVLVSYGLITLGFITSLFYLGAYYLGRFKSAPDIGETGDATTDGSGSIAGAALGLDGTTNTGRQRTLKDLDTATMIVLQLAFWTLGVGILLGAWWADHSWGRWWAWDPKETWALATWIIYLIVIHVRIMARNRGLSTAWLSIVGFIVMLWTYFGVNLLLPGLHAYA